MLKAILFGVAFFYDLTIKFSTENQRDIHISIFQTFILKKFS